MCSQINHFPEDADFDHDGAEYVLRKSRTTLSQFYFIFFDSLKHQETIPPPLPLPQEVNM